jgi:chromosome segregation and condensation protein ScpB
VDGLRERLRECFKGEANYELRAVASMTNAELIEALLTVNELLGKVGLQVRIAAGMVPLSTTQVESEALRSFISEYVPKVKSGDLNENALEVLACIAHKQPLCQAEIDRYFEADKRGVVQRLREMELVTEFAGKGGRLEYATTDKFLSRFGLGSLVEMKLHTSI